MSFKLTYTIWTISFIISGITIAFMNWIFFASFAVFSLTSLYIERNEKRFKGDLDEIFGRDDNFK